MSDRLTFIDAMRISDIGSLIQQVSYSMIFKVRKCHVLPGKPTAAVVLSASIASLARLVTCIREREDSCTEAIN